MTNTESEYFLNLDKDIVNKPIFTQIMNRSLFVKTSIFGNDTPIVDMTTLNSHPVGDIIIKMITNILDYTNYDFSGMAISFYIGSCMSFYTYFLTDSANSAQKIEDARQLDYDKSKRDRIQDIIELDTNGIIISQSLPNILPGFPYEELTKFASEHIKSNESYIRSITFYKNDGSPVVQIYNRPQ